MALLLCLWELQGIETVRRDNCLLVRNVVSTCLEKILMEKDEEGAKQYVRSIIGDLLMNRMDLSLLVVTKASSGSLRVMVLN
jgi:DNA polymerase delta subunit 1